MSKSKPINKSVKPKELVEIMIIIKLPTNKKLSDNKGKRNNNRMIALRHQLTETLKSRWETDNYLLIVGHLM